jgi:Plavaka transposase
VSPEYYVRCGHITAIHKCHELVFEFWCHSLWDWVLNLVGNPLLAPYFEWDAQKLFKHDGTKFVRFVHEPWTADQFWKVQVSLLFCN